MFTANDPLYLPALGGAGKQLIQPEWNQLASHSQGLDAWFIISRPVNSSVRIRGNPEVLFTTQRFFCSGKRGITSWTGVHQVAHSSTCLLLSTSLLFAAPGQLGRSATSRIEMSQALIIALVTISLMGCPERQYSKESVFWRWFQANETRLFDFEKDQERIFDELGTQLHRIQPSLTFEFGPKQDGQREFVISADGIKDAFPAVIALADAAPSLPRWKITKFRPRRGFQGPVTYNGLRIAPEQVQFTIEQDGEKAGITLFIEGYKPTEHEKYASVVYLMLDQALGEYDVETKVGFIEFKSNSAQSKLTKQPFSALAQGFDRLLKSNAK